MDIYFRSSNAGKRKEFQRMLNSEHIRIVPIPDPIHEIQSKNMDDIVIDKVVKAFKDVMRPVIVEHTGLMLRDFGELPGGLGQIFWDSLGADQFATFFAHTANAQATAKTVIAFCDGHQIKTFEGEIAGQIVDPPRGDRAFQWDCVFQPNDYDLTFAQMAKKLVYDEISMKRIPMKDKISMRRIAIEKLKKYLEEEIHD